MTSAPYVRTRHELGQFAKARADAEVREDIQRGRAVHTVAGHSVDAEDCRRLLSMLGLEASRPNA